MPNTPSPEAVWAARDEATLHTHHPSAKHGYYVQELLNTQTASLRKRVEELELMNLDMKIRLSLWSSTIQRYQSWKANNVPDRDYPNAIIADYERLSQFPTTKSELLEEVVKGLTEIRNMNSVGLDMSPATTEWGIADRLLKRLTPQP